jgi:uncharacterized protein YajQ (UPF0234 family)
MPSFDVVNKLDLQLVDNAINTAGRRIAQRYDFKGVTVVLELNKKDKTLKVEVPDDMKLKAVKEIVHGALMDQGVSMKIVDWGKEEAATLGTIRLHPKLRDGIEKELAKTIVAKIKDLNLKVKASIQGEQIRVEGKAIDDLQAVIQALKADESIPVPLQFDNMKR